MARILMNRLVWKKANWIRLITASLLVVLLVMLSMQTVYASSGWVDRTNPTYEKLYGKDPATSGDAISNPTYSKEPGFVEEAISEFFTDLAISVNELLTNCGINLSLEGIIFGRMSYSVGNGSYVHADFTHFGLEPNNPWGIIGATVFYLLRGICLTVMPIVLLVMLIKQLFHNTPKGRAELKELAIHTVYVFALLFIMPYLLDLFIYFRDVVMYAVSQGLTALATAIANVGASDTSTAVTTGPLISDKAGQLPQIQMPQPQSSGVTGIIDTLVAMQNGRFLNTLVLFAAVMSGVFYLIDYIKTAALLMATFGLFPMISMTSFWNKKIMSGWSNVFFPNLITPFIDMILVMVPSILSALFERLIGPGSGATLVIAIIIIVVIWYSMIVRTRILKLFGFDGIGAMNLGQMLNTLAHTLPGRGFGGNVGRNMTANREQKETSHENMERSERAAAIGREMDSAVDEMIEKGDMSLFGTDDRVGSDSETNKVLSDMDEHDSAEMSDLRELSGIDGIDENANYDAGDMVMNDSRTEDELVRMMEPADGSGLVEHAGGEYDAKHMAPPRDSDGNEYASEFLEGGDSSPVMNLANGFDAAEGFKPSTVDYSSHYDGKFASDTLSGRDRDIARYENLARRDGLREKMSQNERVMSDANYSAETYADNRAELVQMRDGLGQNVGALKNEKLQMEARGEVNTDGYRTVTGKLQEAQEAYAGANSRIEKLDLARRADAANQIYKKEAEKCDRNEYRYAEINGYGGGSTRTYASADAYKHSQRVEAIKRKQADYKNFDSNQYKGMFTPEEEVNFRRQREANRYRDAALEAGKNAAITAGKIAVGGTLGVVGAFGAGYGGMAASIGAGIAGVAGGGKIVNTLGYTPEAFVAATGVSKNVAITGARIARESIQSAYTRDKAVFTNTDIRNSAGKNQAQVHRKMQQQANAAEWDINSRLEGKRHEMDSVYRDAKKRAKSVE